MEVPQWNPEAKPGRGLGRSPAEAGDLQSKLRSSTTIMYSERANYFLQLILILDNDGRDAMGSVRTKRTAAEFATGRTCPCNVANVDFSVYQTYLIHFAIRAVHRDPLLLYSVRCQLYSEVNIIQACKLPMHSASVSQ